MEEEEIQSYASPEGAPQSPPGRITVTVAAPAPQSTAMTAITKYASPVTPLHQSPLTLALPIQHTTRPIGSSSGGREDCWSEGATSVLIDAWGERYMELSRGNLKQKHWKEVADIVSSREEDYTKTPKTDIQCKNRIDTVKKKYKVEKAKVTSGSGPSHWPFFERLDRLLSPSTAASAAKLASPATATATATVASVGINSQKAVPMGIPVGVRPMPLPGLPHYSPHHHLKIPPHLQPQLQPPPPPPPPQRQQQFRQNNFPFLPPMLNKFNNSANNNANNNANSISNNNKPQFKRGPPPPPPVDSDSDQEEGWSQGSADSLPPLERKRPRVEFGLGGKVNNENKGKEDKARKVWGSSVRELTRAILKFGEVYEAAESAKLEQIVEIEKQRMKFTKELELQRMKFLMKTQLELSKLNDNGSNNSDARGEGSSGRAGGAGVGGSSHHNHHNNHLSQALSDASD